MLVSNNIFKIDYSKLKEHSKKILEKIRTKENNKDIIMGADLSGNSTGICIIDTDNNILFMDKIYIPSYNNTSEDLRILIFKLGIETVINKYKPHKVIIEDIFSDNVKTHKTLAKIHGIFLEIMLMNNIECYYIHPSSAKAFLNNKEKHEIYKTKDEVYAKLTSMYGLNLDFKKCNDGIDALLMALNHKNNKIVKKIGVVDNGKRTTKRS